MHRHVSAGILGFVTLLMSITAADAQQNWQVHNNLRYGFSLTYPSPLFALATTSEQGDGHIFDAPSQNARLLAGVIVNRDGHTPASYFKFVASTSYAGYKVTYRKIGPSWFAISGEKDDTIFYEKVQFSCNSTLITSFAVIYPAANQRVINPAIERMENSFRSARNCSAANVSAPPPMPGGSRKPG
jgi:hypothetical protein